MANLKAANALYLGSASLSKAYYGSTQVWPTTLGGAWSPTDDAASFAFMLDPSDPAARTLVDGKVTGLSDKINSNDFIINVPANGPTLSTLNGSDVMLMDASVSFFRGSSAFDVPAKASLFHISRVDAGGTGSLNRWSFYDTVPSFAPVPLAGNGDGSPNWLRASNVGQNEANCNVRINSVLQGFTTRNSPYAAHVNSLPQVVEYEFTFGASSYLDLTVGPDTASYQWSGLMGPVLCTSGEITSDIREKIEGFLAWKAGVTLPIDHQYHSAPP